MNTAATDLLLADIEARRDAVVALTQAMVRVPTVNPPGDAYEQCARLIGDRLRAQGWQVALIRATGAAGDSDAQPRVNVLARYEHYKNKSNKTSRDACYLPKTLENTVLDGFSASNWQVDTALACVHFNGHIDVVETGPGWSRDPFGAQLIDGKIYGRGTCDMKGGLASAIVACEALIELAQRGEIDWEGALEISGTVDEESGGYAGVGYLAQQGFFSNGRVDHVIIPEPLGVDRICLGHRGVWWAQVETSGRIAHGSMPFLGDSAIAHMAAFVSRIETELQPKLKARLTAQPVEPPGARASTLNINSIHGGQVEQRYATNERGEPTGDLPAPVVAHSCRAVLDRRFIAEETLESVKAEIVDMLNELKSTRPGFDYRVEEIMSFVPSATAQDAPVVMATARAIARVLGKEPSFISSPGTYDQKHIVRTANLKHCIAYGPGILDLAHQPDEYVGVDELVHSAQVMALAAIDLLNRAKTAS
jgi:succinyl-diaminopimelate desuccinylase